MFFHLFLFFLTKRKTHFFLASRNLCKGRDPRGEYGIACKLLTTGIIPLRKREFQRRQPNGNKELKGKLCINGHMK